MKALDIDWAVISSCVGPIPPVVNTYSNFLESFWTLFIIILSISGIILTSPIDIPHLIFRNKDPNEHYIKRVYRAWNYGGFNAPGDIIVFVNSDTSFSPFWLNNLSKNLTEKRIITSRVVEPGKLKQAKYAITKNFGTTYSEFDDESFQKFVDVTSKNKIMSGENDFMPCMIYKDIFIKSGGYPIGNRTEKNGNITSGDWIFFYENLKSMGVKHYCIFDSIVYHIQEGEMDSS